jgi:Domain of unknown function (DUF5615)
LSFRFQTDADLNPEIGRRLQRREPSIDFRAAVGVIADGTPDSDVPQIAAADGRMLVSRDVPTMPDHFARFRARHESPGLLLIPSRMSIGTMIEELLMVWLTWTPEELGIRLVGFGNEPSCRFFAREGGIKKETPSLSLRLRVAPPLVTSIRIKRPSSVHQVYVK